MRCKNCGVDCDPQQLFCLRCGTPLDFSSEETKKEIDFEDEEIQLENSTSTLDLESDDIDLLINMDMMERNKFKREPVSNKVVEKSDARTSNKAKNIELEEDYDDDYDEEDFDNTEELEESFFNKNKILIIGGIVVSALIIAAIIFLVFVSNAGRYDEYYQNGIDLYNKGKVQPSITQFVKAAELAKTDEEKKSVYLKLWEAYSQIDGYENEQIDILKKLIKLEPENESYYQALIVLYDEKGNEEEINNLIESVTDEDMKQRLIEFDATMPVPTVAPGEYNKPIKIALTSPAGSDIHYTINGGDATASSDTYTKEIEMNDEGEYTLRAVAIDKNGKESDMFEGVYKIVFNTVSEPIINLDSGIYNEQEKVVVKCDEGCTVYYTTDGSEPTEESKKYTKSFKIPQKNTVYNFVAIDENGVSSKVVSRVYQYQRQYKYSFDDARSTIASSLINQGLMENKFGSYEDGSQMYIEYDSVQEIDKVYYYIIKATKETANGGTSFSETYAFNTETAEFSKATYSGGKYIINSDSE